ncbi:serine hydrolase domain-containing protein [Streptomyces sp. M10(2022)]
MRRWRPSARVNGWCSVAGGGRYPLRDRLAHQDLHRPAAGRARSPGEVRYSDRADRYLPCRIPGPPVTLLHLATHTSGLPRLPPGLVARAVRSGWLSNPYARFDEGDLLAALERVPLRHRPGTRVHYSNFGAGLLGHVLARAAGGTGGDYAALLGERVTNPSV